MKTVTRADDAQLELPIDTLDYPDYEQHLTIQERFALFHRRNRWVAAALELLTEDWLERGNSRASIDMFMHVLRHQYGRQTTGDGGFKLNNDFTSRYARLLIDRHPDWSTVFYTRELKTP